MRISAIARIVSAVFAALASTPARTAPDLQAVEGSPRLAPLVVAGADRPPAPWAFAGLPGQSLARTRFAVVEVDGRYALRVESPASYGNLVHPLSPALRANGTLSWSWRMSQPLRSADLRHKAGDDTAVKVCVFFEPPVHTIPLLDRLLLSAARAASGQDLPAATLCYVWDRRLMAGTVLPNAYTGRMRWMVLRSADAPIGQWVSEQRDLARDYRAAFDAELPPVTAIAVGADTDNTGEHGLAYLADLRLER